MDRSAPEVYAKYGYSFLMARDDPDRAVEMLEESERLLPSDPEIRLHLAEAYAAVGRRVDAEASARAALAWSSGEDATGRRARELIATSSAQSGVSPE